MKVQAHTAELLDLLTVSEDDWTGTCLKLSDPL